MINGDQYFESKYSTEDSETEYSTVQKWGWVKRWNNIAGPKEWELLSVGSNNRWAKGFFRALSCKCNISSAQN